MANALKIEYNGIIFGSISISFPASVFIKGYILQSPLTHDKKKFQTLSDLIRQRND